MSMRTFYEARAAECAREAAETPLAQVRVRALRAQEAWLEMTGRSDRTDALRVREAARKAAAAS